VNIRIISKENIYIHLSLEEVARIQGSILQGIIGGTEEAESRRYLMDLEQAFSAVVKEASK
jgi:hypothetical protein